MPQACFAAQIPPPGVPRDLGAAGRPDPPARDRGGERHDALRRQLRRKGVKWTNTAIRGSFLCINQFSIFAKSFKVSIPKLEYLPINYQLNYDLSAAIQITIDNW